jgi:hypothetical protein
MSAETNGGFFGLAEGRIQGEHRIVLTDQDLLK